MMAKTMDCAFNSDGFTFKQINRTENSVTEILRINIKTNILVPHKT